jgi:hypothetical protein
MANVRSTSKNKKSVKNEELAHSLLSWAKSHKVDEDPYVSGLHSALQNNADLAMWSTLVPLEYLPLTQTTSGQREISINQFLVIARNILVFVPVALTWAAVGQATTAFAVYVKANPNSVTNFLEFWQDGFGVLGSEWTIGHIANLDFLLISAVILLTMATSYLGKKGQKFRKIGQRKVDAERMKLGLALTEFLYTKRAVTPTTLNQNVSTSITSLRNASKSLEKNMAAHNKAVASFEKRQK